MQTLHSHKPSAALARDGVQAAPSSPAGHFRRGTASSANLQIEAMCRSYAATGAADGDKT